MSREHIVSLRLNNAERALLDAEAGRRGVGVSGVVRDLIATLKLPACTCSRLQWTAIPPGVSATDGPLWADPACPIHT